MIILYWGRFKLIDDRSSSRLPIHDLGTLHQFTRWISSHEQGIAEWFKNVRLAYQEGRANVKPHNRTAVLLLKDADKNTPSQIGLLDVGGFTFEDVKSWSVWNDPEASSRGSKRTEETQGNGGKAYSYKMFRGPSYILGVKEKLKNQVGFIGESNSLERGLPRYYPASEREVWQSKNKLNSNQDEKDIPIEDWNEEIVKELIPFKTGFYNLPKEMKDSITRRKAFTITVGIDAIDWGGGVSNVKQLIKQILHNAQSQRAIQQVKFYVIHNGKLLFKGEPLELEKIEPYKGFEGPFEYPIPEILLAPDGNQINTTKSSSGKHPLGKITLFTSKESMESSWKLLKPRWTVLYRTSYEDVGQKSISEIVPTTPGSHYIYATVDLDALSPDSVDAGRKRPNDTRLVLATDKFLAEKIIELAKKINELQKQEVSESILEEIEKENEFLNRIKNKFLPPEGGFGLGDTSGEGEGKKKKSHGAIEYGVTPKEIKVTTFSLKIAEGVSNNLISILHPTVRDENDKPVKANILFKTDTDCNGLIDIDNNGNFRAISKGNCILYLSVPDAEITSPPISIEIIKLKDVLLSPREMKIGVGHSKQIIAQITTDEDVRHSDVILDWRHDAADQNMIKISPRGFVFGNKVGKTAITAGSNSTNGIWASNWTSIEIIPSAPGGKGGSGFPDLKITDKHIDPFTGKKREGDPDEPALWQLPHDVEFNNWWLNTQSRDAHFAYEEYKKGNKQLWRMFHAKILVEMVVQAYLQFEYTKKKEGETQALWSEHKFFYDRTYVELTKAMWEEYLERYVRGEFEI